MTKLQNRSKQLQLRLLVDVSGLPPELALMAKEKPAATIKSNVNMASPASENDMTVYRQISGNYFRSLQKA